ncbi:MAG: transporter substrate-binding domain-containing protein [Candidatus Dormibacteria bacterium]
MNRDLTRRTFLALAPKVGATAVMSGSIISVLAACGSSSTPAGGPEDTLSRARRQGYITVGFNDNKPLSYIDPATGKPAGSGLAVLGVALKNLGIPTVHPTVVDFAGIIPGLLDKRWDLSGLAFFLTPARCSQVAFTNPVNQYVEGALVKSGNPFNLHTYADLGKNAQLRVAVQEGDAEVDYAKQAGVKSPVLFAQESLAVQALQEGRVDVYLNSTFALRADITNFGGQGIELAEPFTGPLVNGQPIVDFAGFALRHEDVTLLNALNGQIEQMNKSGQLLTLQQPYGFTAETNPPLSVNGKTVCPDAPWGSGYTIITG